MANRLPPISYCFGFGYHSMNQSFTGFPQSSYGQSSSWGMTVSDMSSNEWGEVGLTLHQPSSRVACSKPPGGAGVRGGDRWGMEPMWPWGAVGGVPGRGFPRVTLERR